MDALPPSHPLLWNKNNLHKIGTISWVKTQLFILINILLSWIMDALPPSLPLLWNKNNLHKIGTINWIKTRLSILINILLSLMGKRRGKGNNKTIEREISVLKIEIEYIYIYITNLNICVKIIYIHTHIKPSQGGASKIHSYPISSFG